MKHFIFLTPLFFLPALFLFTNAGDEDAIAKKKAADDYKTNYVATEISSPDQFGWTGKTNTCKAGKLSHDAYVKILARINYFRRLAGVDDHIVLDSQWCKLAQSAALIMYANNTLNHDPDASMKCFSEDGKLGASTSNLSTIIENSIKEVIADEIQDGSTSNNFCGHRRWLLNSEAYKMGIGATPGAYAVRVFMPYEESGKDTSSFHGKQPEYFGYPFHGYIPYQVVYPKWSFAITNGTPDYKSATVAVTAGDVPLACTIVNRDHFGYGDPTLVWTIKGLKEDFDYNYYDMSEKKTGFATMGLINKKITVKISNVKVNGVAKNYSYSFTIFDPNEVN
jgi:hypothetical protein